MEATIRSNGISTRSRQRDIKCHDSLDESRSRFCKTQLRVKLGELEQGDLFVEVPRLVWLAQHYNKCKRYK
eukprot:755696-Hanusia_phi.AAC.6